MDQHIRNFFWKGGKQNERKIPLVNWETVSKPQMEGGLNFKNLSLQNIAMGAKLLWKIIAPKPSGAQLVLWRKYFKGERVRCLDGPLPQGVSPFVRLCSKAAPLICSKVYWIPGNGKKINILADRIMDRDPIGDCPSVKALRDWLTASRRSTLWDISTWARTRWVAQQKEILARLGPGGTAKNTEGILTHSFAWGLGINSSIQAEPLAIFQGLKLLLNLEIKEANIFGDSQLIIKIMVTNSSPRDLRLARLISRIRNVRKLFQNLKYFHVLRDNNKEVDLEANKAALLSVGAMIRDGDETWDPIP
eukprot:PITA_06085